MQNQPQYLNLHTPPEGVKLMGNTHISAALAYALVDALPAQAQREYDGAVGIHPDHVAPIAELIQEIVAYTVSSLIDAGSEREAVMENDVLATVLQEELRGWVIP